MPGLLSSKNNPTMSLGRNSAAHHGKGTAGSNHFSTVRGPKAYMSQTKASLARRQSQRPATLTNVTFTSPQQENDSCDVRLSPSSSDTAGEKTQYAVSSQLDHQSMDGYHHEDTPSEIMQFRPDIGPKDDTNSFWDTFQDDAWVPSAHGSSMAADKDSAQPWDVNYVHSDSAWEFLQFGTRNFMEGRPISDSPHAVWDAPIEDPIDEDVALQYKLDHEEDEHDDDSCDCNLDRTQIQHSREYANDGCGLVFLACHDGAAGSVPTVCIDCANTPCECDDDVSEQTVCGIENGENFYSHANIDPSKTQSTRYLDKRAAVLIAEVDKLVSDVDYLKRQKLRFARDAARYCNIGQRFRSQLEKSDAKLRNCEFRLVKSRGVSSQFRQAFVQLVWMLHKYQNMGITEEDNAVLGQVRFIIGGLVDLVEE